MSQPENYRQKWGREGYNKAERLWNAGFSIAAIAKTLGRTEKSVKRVLGVIKLHKSPK